MSERNDRSNEQQPSAAVKPEDQELSVEELDEVAGGGFSDPDIVMNECTIVNTGC